MKVEAKVMFDDLKEKVRRNAGDQFTVSEERYEQIKSWVKVVDNKPAPENTKEDKKADKRQTK